MKRLISAILKNPLYIFTLTKFMFLMLSHRLSGKKTVIYNLHQDYFFDLFKDIYHNLTDKGIVVYFSYDSENENLKYYLTENFVPKNRIISNKISPFIPFNMFICAEVTGPDFPFKLLKTKKVEIYHGTGVYNLYEKAAVLTRFDIHFAVGPQFVEFLDSAYLKFPQKHTIYNTGYPKTDRIFKPAERSIIEKYCADEKKIILYAPHWNEFSSLHRFEEELIRTCASFDITVLIKAHNYLYTKFPQRNWKERFEKLSKEYSNIKFVTEADTQIIYPIADIMITDTGTTAGFEFSLLKKPLIVFKDDLWFEGKDHVEVEKAIIDTAFCFRNIGELKDLLSKTIENTNIKSIKDQTERQQIMTQKYLFNIGKATETATINILKELDT